MTTRKHPLAILAAFFLVAANAADTGPVGTTLITDTVLAHPEAAPDGIPGIEAFWDSGHHWRDVHGREADKVVTARPNQPSYKPAQYQEIAANVLLFQNKNGGWAKNYDMCAVYNDAEKAAIRAKIDGVATTFDNESTHCQVAYLAKVYTLSPKPEYRAACERGLRFILDAQLKSGGFPQFWPDPKGYQTHITYNDRVMVGVISVLRDAGNRANGFGWLDDALTARCRAAAGRGLACILATQYRNKDGVLQAWGQQHDPETLQPSKARAYELPSLCAQDSAEILVFLMQYEKPTPEITRSIHAAAKWLQDSAIRGTRYEVYDADAAAFNTHKTTKDRRVVPDANAPLLWARMYELDTNRPQFAGRDGVKHYELSAIDRDRRTGYDWYGFWPAEVLAKDFPAWLAKHAPAKKEKARSSAALKPIETSGFRDSAQHWRNIKNDGYFIQATSKDQPRYDEKQVLEIAANILLFQRANGGWPKDYDMCAILTPDQREKVIATRAKTDTSFDNHGTHPQVVYLAKLHEQTRDDVYRKACERGIDFILSAQYPNGGYPQWYPGVNGTKGLVTLNDGVWMGVLNCLRDVSLGRNGFSWVDAARREKARAAVDKSIACLLKIQYRNKAGELQAWAQQYDQHTLKPAKARAYEHPCNSPQETSEVVTFLMGVEKPAPEIIRSVRAAVAWMEKVKLTGIRVEKVAAEPYTSKRKTSTTDTVVVKDPNAGPLWARQCELETDLPLFSDQSGAIYHSLAEIDRERRSGGNWYGNWPEKIIEKSYPAWLKKNGLK